MPYAMPSPGTSPTSTMVIPPTARAEQKRPARHHQRSVSTDAIPSTSSFIYVHPASPEGPRASTSSQPWSRSSIDAAGPSNGGLPSPLSSRRRVKLFGFTPTSAAADDGPSSQEESSAGEGQQEDQTTPRQEMPAPVMSTAFSFGQTTAVPLVPVPSRTLSTPNATHVENLKSAFGSRKTAMVRKKSGELVRSSLKTGDALRREKARSAPATPVCPKYVHFDTQLEHVKHFLAQQRPAAVSRSGSPVETETEDEPESFPFPAMASAAAGTIKLRLPNFPTRLNHDQDAYVETLEIGKDGKSIRGIVRVRNLAFEKWVAVRFTLDHWQTVSEVSAEHLESMGANSDRFVFNIRLQDLLSRIEEKTMFIAIRFTAGGREIWDNNDGQNYRVEFIKTVAPQQQPAQKSSLTAGKRQTWSVTNAGQAADRMADLRRELDRLVSDDLEPPTLRSPDSRSFTEGSPTVLSNRYDFNHSLKQKVVSRPSYDTYAPASSPPKAAASPYFSGSSSLVNGMPATNYREPVTTSQPSSSTRGGASSPSMRRADLPPDFGAPSAKSYQASSPLYNSSPLYPPPPSQRPPSPPNEMTIKGLYQQYLSHPDVANYQPSAARFNTHPPARSPSNTSGLPPSMHYAPLLPPTFRQHRRRDSPFASPAVSPFQSPNESPADSPVPSPARSPLSTSPPRASSPPLYPTISPPPEMALWSPASSSDALSTSSSTTNYSPDSEATSVAESPSSMSPRPQGPMEFSTFLDRYCFHTSSQPTSLGLIGVGDASSPFPSSLPADYASATPRRSTPLATVSSASSNCGSRAYYSSSSQNSSGSSTPANGQESNPLEAFAAFAPSPAPPAIVS